MKNSDRFYNNALEFQNQRKTIIDEYEQTVAKLESAKGSQYYTDEMKKATEKKEASLAKIKTEYGGSMRYALRQMLEVNGRRAVKAPSTDELAVLQALKMRDKVSQQELDEAAQALKGNKLCLSVLLEIAHQNGIYGHNYLALSDDGEMLKKTADDIIMGVAHELSDFLDYDTSYAARRTAKHNYDLYGVNPNAKPLRKRDLFVSKKGCFSELFGLYDYDAYEAFLDCVDEKE